MKNKNQKNLFWKVIGILTIGSIGAVVGAAIGKMATLNEAPSAH